MERIAPLSKRYNCCNQAWSSLTITVTLIITQRGIYWCSCRAMLNRLFWKYAMLFHSSKNLLILKNAFNLSRKCVTRFCVTFLFVGLLSYKLLIVYCSVGSPKFWEKVKHKNLEVKLWKFAKSLYGGSRAVEYVLTNYDTQPRSAIIDKMAGIFLNTSGNPSPKPPL